MAEPLKNCYSTSFIDLLIQDLQSVHSDLDPHAFRAALFDATWEKLELKERMDHIARLVISQLNPNPAESFQQLLQLVSIQLNKKDNGFNFEYLFLPEALLKLDLSMDDYLFGIEQITQFTSCEFVVRKLMLQDFDRVFKQMQLWTTHSHPYVRRLSSEGIRTRLPWAIKVPELVNRSESLFDVCQALITDSDQWVTKSVSNALNDLSKDFPEAFIHFLKMNKKNARVEERVLKHASRTLLKSGNKEVMKVFDFEHDKESIALRACKCDTRTKHGTRFSFEMEIESKKAAILRLEYRVFFLRKDGTHHPKTFFISEKNTKQNALLKIEKQHSFKPISTRKYYSGTHTFQFVVNGEVLFTQDFELID